MWVYIYQSWTEKELQNAYIGEYPERWQPWANTIAYYPLTSSSTVNDLSWNGYNLTNYNTVTFWAESGSGNVDCAKFSRNNWIYKSWSLFTWNPTFTVSIWSKMDNTSYGWINMRWFWRSSSNYWFWIWIRNGSELYTWVWSNDKNTWATVDTGWHHVVFAYSSWSWTVYLDWTAVYNWTWSPNIQNNNTAIWANAAPWDWWSGYLSEAIFEDKARTAQEVSDYYNQTKAIYGL